MSQESLIIVLLTRVFFFDGHFYFQRVPISVLFIATPNHNKQLERG